MQAGLMALRASTKATANHNTPYPVRTLVSWQPLWGHMLQRKQRTPTLSLGAPSRHPSPKGPPAAPLCSWRGTSKPDKQGRDHAPLHRENTQHPWSHSWPILQAHHGSTIKASRCWDLSFAPRICMPRGNWSWRGWCPQFSKVQRASASGTHREGSEYGNSSLVNPCSRELPKQYMSGNSLKAPSSSWNREVNHAIRPSKSPLLQASWVSKSPLTYQWLSSDQPRVNPRAFSDLSLPWEHVA